MALRWRHPRIQVPFQYSLQVQLEPNREVKHFGLMAEAGADPGRTLLERLLPEAEGDGSILAYHAAFEKRVLRTPAAQFPKRAAAIVQSLGRVVT